MASSFDNLPPEIVQKCVEFLDFDFVSGDLKAVSKATRGGARLTSLTDDPRRHRALSLGRVAQLPLSRGKTYAPRFGSAPAKIQCLTARELPRRTGARAW